MKKICVISWILLAALWGGAVIACPCDEEKENPIVIPAEDE